MTICEGEELIREIPFDRIFTSSIISIYFCDDRPSEMMVGEA